MTDSAVLADQSGSIPGIDGDALAALAAEGVDWRFKGMPPHVDGESVGALAERRLDLFEDGFVGPILVLEAEALTNNIQAMADWCAARGVSLEPHGKTTMAPRLFALQLAAGAVGITAANAAQLRVYRAFGVRRIQLANELITASALQWVAAELDRDPDFEFRCWVDSVAVVRQMTEALRADPPSRPIDVLVEVGGVGGRTGARDAAAAREIADAVRASPVLRLVGVAGYEGALGAHPGLSDVEAVDAYLETLRTIIEELMTADVFADTDRITVTAGGSSYFDRVVAALADRNWPTDQPVEVVLRSGAYLTHDDGLYRRMTPAARGGDSPVFRPAMRVWAQVTSKPEPTLAYATMGRRDVAFDQDMPLPLVRRDAAGEFTEITGARVEKLADQHAFIQLSEDQPLEVGDWVAFGPSHPCTMFDKYDLIPIVQGSTVVDYVRTFF